MELKRSQPDVPRLARQPWLIHAVIALMSFLICTVLLELRRNQTIDLQVMTFGLTLCISIPAIAGMLVERWIQAARLRAFNAWIVQGTLYMNNADGLTDDDYKALADFRFALRAFHAFSEQNAAKQGLTPQQHQALLAIRASGKHPVTVGYVAERLILKPHSATGLVDRLVSLELVERHASLEDRRQALLRLTPRARSVLAELSTTHREEIRRLRPMLTALLSHLDDV